MAERRMFAKQIIDSDAFLDMPASTQSLYFHLGMRGDDEGFINNPKKIQRMVGASDDDIKILIAKNFVIPFESGVCVIKHWKIHNYIRNDRLQATVYQEERQQLTLKNNNVYSMSDIRQTDVSQLAEQVRLGKVRLVEDSIDKPSSPRALLEAESLPKNLIDEWLKIRKAKRAVLTESALNATKREAEKANITLEKAIETCCENSWAGFKAEYLTNKQATNKQQDNSWRNDDAQIMRLAQQMGIHTQGKTRYEILARIDSQKGVAL